MSVKGTVWFGKVFKYCLEVKIYIRRFLYFARYLKKKMRICIRILETSRRYARNGMAVEIVDRDILQTFN